MLFYKICSEEGSLITITRCYDFDSEDDLLLSVITEMITATNQLENENTTFIYPALFYINIGSIIL